MRSARHATICGLLLFPLISNLPAQEQAPSDLSQTPTGEIEKQASFMVGAQKFIQAVPLLTELVSRLGESTDPKPNPRLKGFAIS